MTPTPKDLQDVAVQAAMAAGRILSDKLLEARTVEFKGGIDLVTDADKASEACILRVLKEAYPEHSILAEESGALSTASPYRWVVDPLDGTSNYAHRVPHFSVSIAVEGPEGLLAGVVFDPMRQEMFSAARGQGATLNDKSIAVSQVDTLGRALLCTGFPYDVHQRPQAPLGLFNRFIRRAQGIRRFGSAALDLAYVACGRFDGYFEFRLKPWDLAAGALLVMEAGGVVQSIDGKPLSLEKGHVVTSGKNLFPRLSSECQAFIAEFGGIPDA